METKTELIQAEPPPTLDISEAARTEPKGTEPKVTEPKVTESQVPDPGATAPLVAEPSATAQLAPPSAEPPAPPYPPAPPHPSARSSSDPQAAPPKPAFVPPELLARRRAAAPPSTPYQPIAGWSLAPAAPMEPQVTAPGAGAPSQTVAQQGAPSHTTQPNRIANQPSGPTGPTGPTGPANGFATPTGGSTHAGRAPAPGTPGSGTPVRIAVPGGGSNRGRPLVLAIAAAVTVAVVAVGTFIVLSPEKDTPKAATPKPTVTAAPASEDAKFEVSSYDPAVGGSGFRPKDGGAFWDTATYNSETFGGLKKGVGLVLDLGSAKAVTSVKFKAQTGPLTVQLRSADDKPSGSANGSSASKTVQTTTGETELKTTKGGKHQYWMIWVTNLGPTKKAVISDISVSAAP